jgi:hypothetical protein
VRSGGDIIRGPFSPLGIFSGEQGRELFPVSGWRHVGPTPAHNGALVTVGEVGASVPIGAEETAGGYEVAWKVPRTDQYSVWTTDSSGNYEFTTGIVSGLSSLLQVAESSFHQDLNCDGAIGPHTMLIEAHGSPASFRSRMTTSCSGRRVVRPSAEF